MKKIPVSKCRIVAPDGDLSTKDARVLVRPRLYFHQGLALGPGKIDLLKEIGELGSISAAARKLGIPYKRAWSLVDSVNRGLPAPAVEALTGGKSGGGATLTPLGLALVAVYFALEAKIGTAVQGELEALSRLVADPGVHVPMHTETKV